jgi:hypothetical protein
MFVAFVAALVATSAISFGSPPQPSMESYSAAHYEAYQNTSSPENPPSDLSQVSRGQVAVDHNKGIIQIVNRTITRTGVGRWGADHPLFGGWGADHSLFGGRGADHPLFGSDDVPLTLRYDCNTQSKQEVEYFPRLICKNTSLPIASHNPTREECENWAASLFSPLGFGNLSSPDCDYNGEGGIHSYTHPHTHSYTFTRRACVRPLPQRHICRRD